MVDTELHPKGVADWASAIDALTKTAIPPYSTHPEVRIINALLGSQMQAYLQSSCITCLRLHAS